MTTVFSQVLQRHYDRKGNKILFSNGFTLNHMALTLWEKCGYQGVDASSLTRILKGDRLFTPEQLDVFIKILHLDAQSKKELSEAFHLERIKRFNLESSLDYLQIKQFVSQLDYSVRQLETLALNDTPVLVMDWSSDLISSIDTYLPKAGAYRKELLEHKGELLIHYLGNGLGAISLAKLEATISHLGYKLFTVGKELKNETFVATACYLTANMLRIVGKSDKSHEIMDLGINLGLTDWSKIAAIRSSAIAYGNTNNISRYEERRDQCLKLLVEFPEQADYIYEGLSWGEISLGRFSRAEKYLELAHLAHQKNISDGYRFFPGLTSKWVEIIRNEVILLASDKKRHMTHRLESDVKQALIACQKHGYHKNAEEITKYLSLANNK